MEIQIMSLTVADEGSQPITFLSNIICQKLIIKAEVRS